MLGQGLVTGSYYDPKFLNFTVQPYYNRDQSNSASQSIFNASGVTANANLFSGSHFPGFVGYGKNFNNTGEFGVPGTAGLTTRGSGQTFSVGWSEFLPNLPSATASFSNTSDDFSVLGAEGDIHSRTRLFNLNSNYNFHGFEIQGYFNRQSLGLDTPAFLGNSNSFSSSSSNNYGVMVSHPLPMSGYFTTS